MCFILQCTFSIVQFTALILSPSMLNKKLKQQYCPTKLELSLKRGSHTVMNSLGSQYSFAVSKNYNNLGHKNLRAVRRYPKLPGLHEYGISA